MPAFRCGRCLRSAGRRHQTVPDGAAAAAAAAAGSADATGSGTTAAAAAIPLGLDKPTFDGPRRR